jgi:tetratricopeptide (TPR) repeat protein
MKIKQIIQTVLGIASLFIFGLLFGEILRSTTDRDFAKESRKLLAEGIEAVKTGHYKESVDILSKSLKLDSSNAGTWKIRGDAYFALENYSSAFADYSESLKIIPNAAAFAGLGDVFVKMNNIPEGINSYTKAIELNPDCAAYYFIRGKTFNMQGKYDEAINDFDSALKLEPDNVSYRQNRDFALSLKETVKGCEIHKL